MKHTPLNNAQKLRLINLLNLESTMVKCDLVEFEDTYVKLIDVEYLNHNTESIFLKECDMEFVINGANVERD